jgi:hypothetical protein
MTPKEIIAMEMDNQPRRHATDADWAETVEQCRLKLLPWHGLSIRTAEILRIIGRPNDRNFNKPGRLQERLVAAGILTERDKRNNSMLYYTINSKPPKPKPKPKPKRFQRKGKEQNVSA